MRFVSWEEGRPLVRLPPRSSATFGLPPDPAPSQQTLDIRHAVATALRRCRLDRYFRVPRPYDEARPGPLDPVVAAAVQFAGFDYMWTKTGFGGPRPTILRNDFVALPFTAGNWEGWTPFYTIDSAGQVTAAERRLLRLGKPGWLASNVDSILWMLPGEVLEKGGQLFEVARLVAKGGRSGRLINVTPNVIARYARILSARAGGTASKPIS
jgi:hypothetical protein